MSSLVFLPAALCWWAWKNSNNNNNNITPTLQPLQPHHSTISKYTPCPQKHTTLSFAVTSTYLHQNGQHLAHKRRNSECGVSTRQVARCGVGVAVVSVCCGWCLDEARRTRATMYLQLLSCLTRNKTRSWRRARKMPRQTVNPLPAPSTAQTDGYN